jgi:predicted alpha/beta superfamily hydrolase
MAATRGHAGWLLGPAVAAFALVVLLSCPGSGTALADQKEPTPPQVKIAGTQLLEVNSSITGQGYALYVSLPRGYDDPGRTFPVIYVLDGQWDFTLVHAIYGQQYYDGFMPAALIVGVTWGGENPDYDRRRAFDLTPTDTGQPARFGNAQKFLAFIKNEAIPLVESRYRTKKNDRTLTGSSFAGLFTLYALFHEPDLFNRYALTSPAWGWDSGVLRTYAEKFSKTRLSRPVKVFMAVGEYEDVPGFERLAATMKGFKMAGLELQTGVILGAGHSGAKSEGFTRGLQYVFARSCLSIDPKTLERYVGAYEIGPGATVRLAVENGRLVAYEPGDRKTSLCADTERDFHVVGQFLDARVVEDTDGKVTGLQVSRYDGEVFAKKVR